MRPLALILASLLFVPAAPAQLDREAQIASLSRVASFALVVDVEASLSLTSRPELSASVWQDEVGERLRATGSLVTRETARPDQRHLYVHANVLDFGDGLVPFAIEVSFIQEADLGRRPPGNIQVVTWRSGLVGLVSEDRLATIRASALELIKEFVDDFTSANASG